jgi:hypothetical protein
MHCDGQIPGPRRKISVQKWFLDTAEISQVISDVI